MELVTVSVLPPLSWMKEWMTGSKLLGLPVIFPKPWGSSPSLFYAKKGKKEKKKKVLGKEPPLLFWQVWSVVHSCPNLKLIFLRDQVLHHLLLYCVVFFFVCLFVCCIYLALWMPSMWLWARKISAGAYDLIYLKVPMLPQLLASLALM